MEKFLLFWWESWSRILRTDLSNLPELIVQLSNLWELIVQLFNLRELIVQLSNLLEYRSAAQPPGFNR